MVDYDELVAIVKERTYSQNLICDYDGDIIFFSKKVAKEYKVRYQDILCRIRPCGKLNRPVWDEKGNIVPYKRIFY